MKRYVKYIAFTLLGAALGYAYYYFIGCRTGSCSIKSSPVNMTAFGSIMGLLVSNIIW